MKRRRDRVIRLIAVFRLAKAALLVLGGVEALRLRQPGVMQHVSRLAGEFQSPVIQRLSAKVLHLPQRRIDELAIVTFLYAALFATEGVGLWMGKVWAEWLTIAATASFIPFEIYEVTKRVSAIRISVLAVNIAILVYLIARRRKGGTPALR